MPRQQSAVELNTFVGGLITEASPLTFPANASRDEDNFILNRDGSRSRRLGMDLEDGYQVLDTGITVPTNGVLGTSSFKWNNAGGISFRTLVVIQVGQLVSIYDTQFTPLSSGLIAQYSYDPSLASNRFSYANVDGMLVVCTGAVTVDVLRFNGTNITKESKTLKVRDLFGVQDMLT